VQPFAEQARQAWEGREWSGGGSTGGSDAARFTARINALPPDEREKVRKRVTKMRGDMNEALDVLGVPNAFPAPTEVPPRSDI
jgi:hypothetical protein